MEKAFLGSGSIGTWETLENWYFTHLIIGELAMGALDPPFINQSRSSNAVLPTSFSATTIRLRVIPAHANSSQCQSSRAGASRSLIHVNPKDFNSLSCPRRVDHRGLPDAIPATIECFNIRCQSQPSPRHRFALSPHPRINAASPCISLTAVVLFFAGHEDFSHGASCQRCGSDSGPP